MKCQRIRLTVGFGLGLILVVHLGGCLSIQTQSAQITHSVDALERANASRRAILEDCHREASGWSLVKRFETAHYLLSLCQRGKTLHLLGQHKHLKKFIMALARVDQETILAEGSDRFSYEIRQGTLTVKKQGNIVVQEGVK